jgi:hypothetical protein
LSIFSKPDPISWPTAKMANHSAGDATPLQSRVGHQIA